MPRRRHVQVERIIYAKKAAPLDPIARRMAEGGRIDEFPHDVIGDVCGSHAENKRNEETPYDDLAVVALRERPRAEEGAQVATMLQTSVGSVNLRHMCGTRFRGFQHSH